MHRGTWAPPSLSPMNTGTLGPSISPDPGAPSDSSPPSPWAPRCPHFPTPMGTLVPSISPPTPTHPNIPYFFPCPWAPK